MIVSFVGIPHITDQCEKTAKCTILGLISHLWQSTVRCTAYQRGAKYWIRLKKWKRLPVKTMAVCQTFKSSPVGICNIEQAHWILIH